MNKNSEMSRIVEVQALTAKPKKMEWSATDKECAALAERLKVLQVKDLTASLVLEKKNLIKITGRFTAHIVQQCVVSMEPIEQTVSDEFEDFFGEHKRHAVPVDIDMEAQDVETVENGRIDVGELVIEYLILSIDPFPRKADVPLVVAGDGDERENPFAVLKNLKKIN